MQKKCAESCFYFDFNDFSEDEKETSVHTLDDFIKGRLHSGNKNDDVLSFPGVHCLNHLLEAIVGGQPSLKKLVEMLIILEQEHSILDPTEPYFRYSSN